MSIWTRISEFLSGLASGEGLGPLFDRLRGGAPPLPVETDGTVTPEDAVAYAARILQDQLQVFVHFEDSMAASSPQSHKAIRATSSGSHRRPSGASCAS